MIQENQGNPTPDDEAVSGLTRQGPKDRGSRGFRDIYEKHAAHVYNFLLWMTNSKDTSQDILQTVFIRVWEAKSLPENEEGLRRWLFTTARNAYFDSYRRQSRLARLRMRLEKEYYYAREEEPSGLFWELLSECSETERCILFLHLKAGYSYGEIGSMMNLSENNVRVIACRAIKRLRNLSIRRKKHEG